MDAESERGSHVFLSGTVPRRALGGLEGGMAQALRLVFFLAEDRWLQERDQLVVVGKVLAGHAVRSRPVERASS